MVNFEATKQQSESLPPIGRADSMWNRTSARFLEAVSARQRDQVAWLLSHPNNGGSGLREWVAAIAMRGAMLPTAIPEAVIHVYLNDPEALPLYDCESCGLAIPVRPSHIYGLDGEPDEVHFTTCPACGARTGLFMHFTRRYETSVTDSLRRRPR
jgi:hypothetical protein